MYASSSALRAKPTALMLKPIIANIGAQALHLAGLVPHRSRVGEPHRLRGAAPPPTCTKVNEPAGPRPSGEVAPTV